MASDFAQEQEMMTFQRRTDILYGEQHIFTAARTTVKEGVDHLCEIAKKEK